jgi:hypothetical protein
VLSYNLPLTFAERLAEHFYGAKIGEKTFAHFIGVKIITNDLIIFYFMVNNSIGKDKGCRVIS